MNEVTKYTKLFELLDIHDFSLSNASNNAYKFKELSERLFNDNNDEWNRSWKLYELFNAAANSYCQDQ